MPLVTFAPAKSLGLPSALRCFAAGLALAAAAGFSMPSHAETPAHGPHGGAPAMMGGGMGLLGHGRGLERLLDQVQATPEQRTQIREITRAAHADLMGQRESARGLRAQAMQLFTQPTVDADAAETLRRQSMAQHDQASRRMLQAMLDISRVLTPEQRQQLAQRMAQRADRMHRRMHDLHERAEPAK